MSLWQDVSDEGYLEGLLISLPLKPLQFLSLELARNRRGFLLDLLRIVRVVLLDW